MKIGQIVETGPADQIFADPQQDYTRTLIDATPGKGLTPAAHAPGAAVASLTREGTHEEW
jgi:ABC-type oligopeptide transport system ATPase subunit